MLLAALLLAPVPSFFLMTPHSVDLQTVLQVFAAQLIPFVMSDLPGLTDILSTIMEASSGQEGGFESLSGAFADV